MRVFSKQGISICSDPLPKAVSPSTPQKEEALFNRFSQYDKAIQEKDLSLANPHIIKVFEAKKAKENSLITSKQNRYENNIEVANYNDT